MSTIDQARALLGQRVRVTLGEEDGAPVIAVGLLLGVGQGGEVEVREDDGFVHYCWPMLDIAAVNGSELQGGSD